MKKILLCLSILLLNACTTMNNLEQKEKSYKDSHNNLNIIKENKDLIDTKKASYVSFEICIKEDCIKDSKLIKEQQEYKLNKYKVYFNIINSDLVITLEEKIKEIVVLQEPRKQKSISNKDKEMNLHLAIEEKSNYIHLLNEPILETSFKKGSIVFKDLQVSYLIYQN